MANASDVITYIGVPLAVLGVLPILYTFMLAILTQRRIRASLIQHGHRPVSTSRPNDGFMIRSSPMTSLIEVELPRCTIAPLDRRDTEYWKTADEGRQDADGEHHGLLHHQQTLDRAESTLSMVEEGRVRGFLRGGSWRGFHWKKLIVGRKLYRIQYEDELREPPAEIGFSELVHFLLDWGAVPDPTGWEKLRSGGLWTPAGTVLLRKPDSEDRKQVDWVLRTSMPDESDGILSLSIRWTRDNTSVADLRGASSLPPGWGRIRQPALLEANDKTTENKNDLPARIEATKSADKNGSDSSSFRFRAEENRVRSIFWEQKNVETGSVSEPFRTYEQSSAGLWFACAASALLSRDQNSGGLWFMETPADVRNFVQKDSVPCGVMVILGLLDDADAPQWSTEKDDSMNGLNRAKQHSDWFQARIAAQRLEATMPAEQARVHKMNREAAERQQQHSLMMASMAERREREERRIVDAIASPRMTMKAAAEACLRYLIQQGEVGREWTVDQLAEAVLYLLVLEHSRPPDPDGDGDQGQGQGQGPQQGEARTIVRILDEWMSWTTAGGMKKQQVQLLQGDKVAFCCAVALAAVVLEATHISGGMGRAGADMLDCLGLWRKVRLG